jgi:protoporphyrinogen oxidase
VKVVVIGGGLAGITAAIALAKAKHEVTLLEAKPRLGGATMSFNRDGLVVDTGQHVFLRCCTAYRGLLDRLGMTAHAPLQPRFDVTVVAPGKKAVMKRRRVPAPLHMMPALLGYPFLNTPERLRLTLAALAFRRLNEADPKTDELRLGDWLEAHGQDERTRRVLWDLFSVSSLNVPGDDASLALAAVVVKTGLLGSADAADIGVPALPLGDLHGTAAARVLAKLGATVRLSTKVTTIEPKGEGEFLIRLGRAATPAAPADAPAPSSTGDAPAPPSTGSNAQKAPEPISGSFAQTAPKEALESANEPQGPAGLGADGGEVILADAVVLAVPHEQAAKLIPPGALPAETVDGWAGLGAAPIVNVHVIYDRKVMDVPFAAGVDSPVQWVFDRTRISGMHARGDKGQYLAISLSAADEYALTPVAELREKFVPALAELFPAARDATVTEFFVTREKRATFRQVPGTAKLRPKAATGLPGLVLAGSWTDTGWPDTMEGAVRSGLNAVIALFPPGGTTPRRPPRAGLIAKTAIVSGPPTVDKSSGVSGRSTAGESSGASAADKGSGVSGVPAADKGSRVPGAPAVGQGSEVPEAPAAGESSGVSGRPKADKRSGGSGPPAAGQGVESGGETDRGAPGETSLPGTGARTSELARADGATVNDIDNTSRPEPALGTNTEISGFEPVREAVTEVTEVTNRVNVEPDEREVRS